MPNNNLTFIEKRIKQKYGSRKGLLLSLRYKILYYLGYYKKYQKIDWTLVERFVFVCKGNICRSAYADILARQAGVESASFGIEAIDGAHANRDAILVAQRLGYNLDDHRTTSLDSMVLNSADLVIAMEPQQMQELISKNNPSYQYTLLGLWSHSKQPHINDPYDTLDDYFENCFQVIKSGVEQLIENQRIAGNERG